IRDLIVTGVQTCALPISPPPPMDPAKITPEIVAMVRELGVGLLENMGFPGSVEAEKTQHGIRIALDAGEQDQFLIGKDGETLSRSEERRVGKGGGSGAGW